MKKLLLSLAAVILLFASCGKDDDNFGTSSKATILTSAKWKLTSGSATGSIGGTPQTIDPLTLMQSCQKDDLGVFRADSHFLIDAGSVKCDPADSQQEDVGNWALTDNETKIKFPLESFVTGITIDGGSSKIDYLDYATLKLSGSGTYSSIPFTYNFTLTHVQ